MESKNGSNGVYRHHSAKDTYNEGKSEPQPDAKQSSNGCSGAKSENYSNHAQDKETIREIADADDEFEALKRSPVLVNPTIAPTKYARNFVAGFKILSMNMRDAYSGQLIWTSGTWNAEDMFEHEIKEEIPQDVLKCKAVAREIIFSSAEEVRGFRLLQKVFFQGTCIEEWHFQFGFVIPGSTNTWQQTIDAAPPSEMLPAQALSGNVVFETSFYAGEEFLCKNTVRLFYV